MTAFAEPPRLVTSDTLRLALDGYTRCALWASSDDDNRPLDTTYTTDDLTPEARADLRLDVLTFLREVATNAPRALDRPRDLGADFWLTRNNHGAGFWDGGWGRDGSTLTAIARPYGPSYVFIDGDGRLRVHG